MSLMRNEAQLGSYLIALTFVRESEALIIKNITHDLLERKKFVSNKDVIMELIELLEMEQDERQKDIFRFLLEVLILHISDNI